MSCRVKWNRDFINDHFEKQYVAKEYRTYRENILFEKEIGLLPMTQPYVEKRIKTEKLKEECKELQHQQYEIALQISQKNREIIQLNSNRETERRKYIRKCPKNECQGFLSQNLKCEICSSWVCSDCREIKGTTRDAEHTCNPEILESVRLLEEDTKACPKCSSMIYKIEGCSQMFCTECHTAFNWNTLHIENGVIHNPHYFEWLRSQNNNHGQIERNPNEIVCGRELDRLFVQSIQYAFIKMYNKTSIYTNSEFRNKIGSLLHDKIKPNHPAEYKNILRLLEKSLDLNKRFKESNQYDYAVRLTNFVLGNISRSREFILNIEQHIEIDECVEQLKKSDCKKHEEHLIHIQDIVRNIIHLNHVEMDRWTVHNQVDGNLQLRILYMLNKITPEHFKIHIQKRDKENQRNMEMNNILRMFVSCMTDLLYRLLDKINSFNDSDKNTVADLNECISEIFNMDEGSESILQECNELRMYTNKCIKRVLSTYGSMMKHNIDKKYQYCIKSE